MRRLFCLATLAIAALAPAASAGPLDGRWDATVTYNGVEIPFRIDFAGEGKELKVSLFNGDVPVTSTAGSYEAGKVDASFEHFLGKLAAVEKDGTLTGKFSARGREISTGFDFRATRHVPSAVASKDVPSIDGLWEIPNDSPKGEKAWRFIVRQQGADVRAAILRVDGDTGELDGTYKDGQFILSHFSGSRAALLTIKPQPDGSLDLNLAARGPLPKKLTAWRPADARKKGLAEPSDFAKHTKVKDPNATFKFSGPDLNGRTVTNDDPRFKGKVVVAVVTGTWCPNCHDEAQFLVELDKKYRDKGLEIVALDFEEIEQQEAGYNRLKAFLKKYGVNYTYLIPGDPVEMWVKVPQAENLNSWPTTFFVGRDGRVKRVHSGFAAPASGEFNRLAKEQFVSTIEALLSEEYRASR